jgi:uncharacterized coiled-coil protein SlyX
MGARFPFCSATATEHFAIIAIFLRASAPLS